MTVKWGGRGPGHTSRITFPGEFAGGGEPDGDTTPPTITSAGPLTSYADGATLGGTLMADEAVTWSVSGADAALVTLNTSTGEWSLPTLDYATKSSYDWTFTATDGASLTDTQAWTFTVTETSAIPTPTITKTSAAGDPMTFSIDDLGYMIGYYIGWELASDSGFTTALSGEGAIREGHRILTSTDFTDDDADGTVEMDPISGLENQPAGDLYVRVRFGREADDGLSIDWGSWSNTLNDTIVILQPSAWDATAKAANITRSGATNLIASNALVNQGAEGRIRADNSRTGKRYCEVTLTDLPTQNVRVGVAPSTHPWTTVSNNVPGSAANPAGSSQSAAGANITNPTGSSSVSTNGVIASCSTGDTICIAFDTTVGKVWFGRIPSGGTTITWNGDPASGTGGFSPSGMTDWYVFASINITSANQRLVTANFGASAFIGTVPTGFEAYT